MEQPILSIRNISKEYPGVKALDDVSFDIPANVVHCIVGENGAGKSTLIKILTGAIEKTRGSMLLNGQEYHPKSIKEAMRAGISVLYQELNVVDELTVEENLTLGAEDTRFGVIRHSGKTQRVYEVLHEIDPSIQLKEKVEKLSMAKKQIVEIAKAVAANASILIMDEPTAALSEEEVRKLFTIIHKLREQEVTVIYISHRLDEIMTICDEITVFKDGKKVFAASVSDVSKEEIITAIAGHEVKTLTTVDYNLQDAKTVLEVAHLSDEKKVRDVSFSLKEGEVLGITGLVGAGRSELVLSVFGYNKIREGTLLLDGKEYVPKNPEYAVKRKLALVPENRRSEGLICSETVTFNINLPTLSLMRPFRHLPFIQGNKGRRISEEIVSKLQIKTKDVNEKVMHLSGGNQQKVVLGKWLKRQPRIIILDEPTQGVDVGARAEIYKLIREMAAKQKVSFIIVSSDVEEIPGLCDRVLVMVEGRISGELLGEDISKENILRFCYKHDQR